MVKKILVSLVLAGTLAMGSAGVAAAAPSSSCANAPATIARLKAEEANIASMLATLKAEAAHAGHHGAWLQWPIAFLSHAESYLAAQVSQLQARCPSGLGSGGPTIVA